MGGICIFMSIVFFIVLVRCVGCGSGVRGRRSWKMVW